MFLSDDATTVNKVHSLDTVEDAEALTADAFAALALQEAHNKSSKSARQGKSSIDVADCPPKLEILQAILIEFRQSVSTYARIS